MNDTELLQPLLLNPSHPGDAQGSTQWRIVGTGDFNADGKVDIAFQHADGTVATWYMDGVNLINAVLFNPSNPGPDWAVKGVADLNNDGKSDLIWQHTDSSVAVWFMNGINLQSAEFLTPRFPGGTWKIVAP